MDLEELIRTVIELKPADSSSDPDETRRRNKTGAIVFLFFSTLLLVTGAQPIKPVALIAACLGYAGGIIMSTKWLRAR